MRSLRGAGAQQDDVLVGGVVGRGFRCGRSVSPLERYCSSSPDAGAFGG